MKTKQEAARFLAMGEKTCDLLRIAYPDYEIAVEYNDNEEELVFSMDDTTYKVNVHWDSVQAGLRDIASQFLTKELYA